MKDNKQRNDEIAVYIEDTEYIANTYVMRCYFVMMVVFTLCYVLNYLEIFVVEQSLMQKAYFSSLFIYLTTYLVTKRVSLSNQKMKYFILFAIITMITVASVFITYHAILIPLLPFLYATLYSSKRMLWYVYLLTVPSTIIIVYGGFYFGLCDANMALLTAGTLQNSVQDGHFILTEVNTNPLFSLMLFFVVPRCFVYVAFMSVCGSIFKIVSGSLEKVKLTAELEKAKEEAERANKAKSQFLAKMSHEIRTPVNAVLGINEMILRESSEGEIRAYAQDVKNSSITLLNIINEILDSSKIESGKMELVEGNYEIGSLLNDLYHMIRMRAKDKELELNFKIAPHLPNEYYGDDKCIRQVLLNLLTNAVKYTNRGSVTLQVDGRTVGEKAFLRFAVSDTGIGIKEEDLGKLTEEFKRLDESRNRSVEGTGLGLNIAQQFLQLMGSQLEIESVYEKGSTFSFLLEQRVVNPETVGSLKERLRQATESEEYRTEFYAPEARILVVDDYKMNLKVFKGLLKQTGMQIFEAESGKACLEFLEKETADIVFLDHMMPEMDGIQVLHEIRRRKLCVGVPMIMLTANAITGDRERYLKEGFDDFISKPIVPKQLDEMVLRYLPEHLVLNEERKEPASLAAEAGEVKGMRAMEQLKKVLPEIDFEVAEAYCGGDEAFYVELLGLFSKLTIKEELEQCLEAGNLENYCVHVHGFKNNAYSIGATVLGDLAYEMEKLTRKGSSEGLSEMQERLFEQYERICVRYRETASK